MGVALLTITCSDPLATFLLPVPMLLHSVGLEVLVPEGGMLLPGDTIMSSVIELAVKTWPHCTPHASESAGKEKSYCAGQGDWSWLSRGNCTAARQWT